MGEGKVLVMLEKQELALAHRALMELPLKRTDPAYAVCSGALEALAAAFKDADKVQAVPEVETPAED